MNCIIETNTPIREDISQHASLLPNESRTPNERAKYTLIVFYHLFYLCLYVQCHDTCKKQNVKLVTLTK